jgi:hypothetical protein
VPNDILTIRSILRKNLYQFFCFFILTTAMAKPAAK